MTKISFDGNELTLGDCRVVLAYPVKDAFELDGKVIVLLDPDANLGRDGQFANLMALSPAGEHLWTAQLPTDKPADVYYRIISRQPLLADSFCSYECELDPQSGRIISKKFFK
jgi:hypothetical protein